MSACLTTVLWWCSQRSLTVPRSHTLLHTWTLDTPQLMRVSANIAGSSQWSWPSWFAHCRLGRLRWWWVVVMVSTKFRGNLQIYAFLLLYFRTYLRHYYKQKYKHCLQLGQSFFFVNIFSKTKPPSTRRCIKKVEGASRCMPSLNIVLFRNDGALLSAN